MSEMHKEQASQQSSLHRVHENCAITITTIFNGRLSTESRKVLPCPHNAPPQPESHLESEEGGEGHDNTDENPW
jgi:hypothetical protein